MSKNLARRRIAMIVLRAKSNRLEDLLVDMPACWTHLSIDKVRRNRKNSLIKNKRVGWRPNAGSDKREA